MRTIPLPKESRKAPYKVAIYCRVGSKEQLTPALMEQPLRERIENTPGCSYVGAYWDCGVRGPLMKRPALAQLTAAFESRTVDIVVMQNFSRLGMNRADCLQYLRLLESYGAMAYFASEDISTADVKERITWPKR